MTQFKLAKCYPPDRENAIIEINMREAGGVATPLLVGVQEGEAYLETYSRSGDLEWQLPHDVHISELQEALRMLGLE